MPGVRMPVTDDQKLSLFRRAQELCRRADFQDGSLFDPDLALDMLQWLIEGGYNRASVFVDPGVWKDVAKEQIEIILMAARERRYYWNRFGKIYDFRPFWTTLQTIGLDVIKRAQKLGLEFHYFPNVDCAESYGICDMDQLVGKVTAGGGKREIVRKRKKQQSNSDGCFVPDFQTETNETYRDFFNLCDDRQKQGKTVLVDMRPRDNGWKVFPDDNFVMPEIERLAQSGSLSDYSHFRDENSGGNRILPSRCGLTSAEWECQLGLALYRLLANGLLRNTTLRWTLRLERYSEAWLIPKIYADSPRAEANELVRPIQVWLEEYCRDPNGDLFRLIACEIDENEVLQVSREPLDQRRANLALRPIIVFEN